MKVPQSIEVQSDASPQSVIIGGASDVSLSLEYLIEEGAASPSVELTAVLEGTTTTWSATESTPGYHVESALMSAKPGTTVTIAATDAMARLRWCETICC
jgi:hypothetical protein